GVHFIATTDVGYYAPSLHDALPILNRIASQASFNGLKGLDGTFGVQNFQVGANAGETISVRGGDARGSQLGAMVAQTTGFAATVLEPTETSVSLTTLVNGLDLTTNIEGTITLNGVDIPLAT